MTLRSSCVSSTPGLFECRVAQQQALLERSFVAGDIGDALGSGTEGKDPHTPRRNRIHKGETLGSVAKIGPG